MKIPNINCTISILTAIAFYSASVNAQTIIAQDTAGDAAYDSEWIEGSNGGFGFDPWTFGDESTTNSTTTILTFTDDVIPFGGDGTSLNTNGRGFIAYSAGNVNPPFNAINSVIYSRTLTDNSLMTDDSRFRFVCQNIPGDQFSFGLGGVSVLSGSDTIVSLRGSTAENWQIQNGSGGEDTGIPSDQPIVCEFVFDLVNSEIDVSIIPLISGSNYSRLDYPATTMNYGPPTGFSLITVGDLDFGEDNAFMINNFQFVAPVTASVTSWSLYQ